jgi:hypothetical protein
MRTLVHATGVDLHEEEAPNKRNADLHLIHLQLQYNRTTVFVPRVQN